MEKIDVSEADISAHLDTLNKNAPSVADHLFKNKIQPPEEYIETAGKAFHTPFFKTLKILNKNQPLSEHVLTNVMNVPLPDAKALAETLR